MKTFKCFLPVIFILLLVLGAGCTKKVIHTEATPYASIKAESKPATIKPEEKPAAQTETPAPDSLSAQEQERKIKEEALREEALRRKSLKEATAPKEASAREEASRTLNLESIYFDFNQAVVRLDQKEIMMKNAQWLKANPQARIKIEGNCDERGTAEYNLALGQRRADVTKDFLEGLGIASKRMQTISYGFERPLVRGVDETSWAKNRRVDFVLIR